MKTFGETFSPTNGIFSHMPTDAPWSGVLTPSRMDVKAWASLRDLEVSMLTDALSPAGVTNVSEIAAIVYEMYQSNWKRLWDALIVEYDILAPSSLEMTRTVTTENDDLETRNLSRTDGSTNTHTDAGSSQNIRTGGSTTTSESDGVTEADGTTSATETLTDTDSRWGIGGASDTPTEKSVTTRPTSGTSHDEGTTSQSGTEGLVYNDLKDASSDTRTASDTMSGTSADTGTVANTGNKTETETIDQKGASSLNSHQELITEEVVLRTGVGANFLALVIGDVRREVCARVWRRGDVFA